MYFRPCKALVSRNLQTSFLSAQDSVRATRSLMLPPHIESEGLQAVTRFVRTSAAELGFVNPEVPAELYCHSKDTTFETIMQDK